MKSLLLKVSIEEVCSMVMYRSYITRTQPPSKEKSVEIWIRTLSRTKNNKAICWFCERVKLHRIRLVMVQIELLKWKTDKLCNSNAVLKVTVLYQPSIWCSAFARSKIICVKKIQRPQLTSTTTASIQPSGIVLALSEGGPRFNCRSMTASYQRWYKTGTR